MKSHDWNTGHRIPLLAHAFDLTRGLGVDIHITAASEDEAKDEVERKLHRRQDFLDATHGHYGLKFARELNR